VGLSLLTTAAFALLSRMACYPRQIGEADAFHTRLRFVKVGAAVLLGGAKTVRDLEQALSRD